jgi:hypothetical protein
MDFDLNEDQTALLTGIQQLLAKYRQTPAGAAREYLQSVELEHDLNESGFLDVARQNGMGPLEATLLIEEVAKLPFAVEVTASAMVSPQLSGSDLPRPLALTRAPLSAPVRFVTGQSTVLVDCGDQVKLLPAGSFAVSPAKGTFAYPYAQLSGADLGAAPVLANAAPTAMRHWWALGLCSEIIGAGQAALDLAVQHVKTRRQFGQPLGAFQAIQHRLSECAMLLHGARLMARHAAWTRVPADAALAAGYCQEMAAQLAYETAQFHGAIGITLEYPLHFFTYRLRMLQGELGGGTSQYGAAAPLVFPAIGAA